ncbi:DUF4411 family protein [Undibacterium sp. TC4M20W]|uniref:DUF4411 family protein n=1 Tax=Undibacterium sp. TC4M20W TaxID=3413052 RepID=UPI003BF0E4A4
MQKTLTRYLLDSDVLISAKNLHYNPKFCGVFWSWINEAHNAGNLFSVDKVKNELLSGGDKDVLYEWATRTNLSSFFLKTNQCAKQWGALSAWAHSPAKAFKEVAKAKFLDIESADAWLIAYAAEHKDCVIVTNEVSAPFSKSSIKLPDAAAHLGVKTTTIFDLLCRHSGSNFIFSP